MSLIEGVGDEVVLVLSGACLLAVVVLAWLSTYVADNPLHVIVIDWAVLQRLLARLGNITERQPQTGNAGTTPPSGNDAQTAPGDETQEPSDQPENRTEEADETDIQASSQMENEESHTSSEEISNAGATLEGNVDSTDDTNQPDGADTQLGGASVGGSSNDGPTEPCVSDNELRQRRVAFYSKNKDDSSEQGSPFSTAPSVGESIPQPTESSFNSCDNTSSISEANIQATSLSSQRQGINTESAEATNASPGEGTSSSGPAEGTSAEVNIPEPREGHIRIRLKYLDDRLRWVEAQPEMTIGNFKRLHFAAEMSDNVMIRLIFSGQELKQEHKTLAAYNLQDESVIHVLQSRLMSTAQAQPSVVAAEFDIGSLMFPLFGLILLLVWYLRVMYRQYFNAMSTFSLVGITFLFIVALLASLRTQEVHDHDD